MSGFFKPGTWNRKVPLPLVPMCSQCRLFETCDSPKMPVSGQGRKKVLIVAEAPGKEEDRRGFQLCGNAGAELIRILFSIGINMRRDCWLTNSVICRPQDNRTPTNREISYCRANLSNTLKSLQPDVVIPMGGVACKSLLPLAWGIGKESDIDEVTTWVGWQIPSIKLNTWICPTYHPSFLLHAKDPVAELHVVKHLKAAFALKGRPHTDRSLYSERVIVILDTEMAANTIRNLMEKSDCLAFDFETTTLKPDGPHAEIICCSVSDGNVSVAFPWQGEAIAAMKELFTDSSIGKVSHNLKFEDRWVRAKLGIAIRNWTWDTMLATHWLDCRGSICSLKFQSFVRLGVEDYDSALKPYIEVEGSNSSNRLREVEPKALLFYCGMDSLLTMLIARKQMAEGGEA